MIPKAQRDLTLVETFFAKSKYSPSIYLGKGRKWGRAEFWTVTDDQNVPCPDFLNYQNVHLLFMGISKLDPNNCSFEAVSPLF